jgi:hypothetical protein
MPKRTNKPISEEELAHKAIQVGLNALISSEPELKNYAVLINNNIDAKKIYSFINGVKEELKKEDISYEEKKKTIYESLANYVASGNALKETARQTILERSHEGKFDRSFLEKIVEIFKPHKFEGEKYFEKSRNLYSDMYDILSQDKAAQEEIPELTKAAKAMKMYGYLDVALKSFKAHGMMDDKTYKKLSQTLYKNTMTKSEEGKKGLENYILSREHEEKQNEVKQKIAASVLGFAGIMIMLFNLTITGAVIGENSQVKLGGIIGMILLFIGGFLFVKPLKKKL